MDLLKKAPLLSFRYGEKNAFETPFCADKKENGNEFSVTYRFENGLQVTTCAKKYDDFGAYEWVSYFENVGKENTLLISDLWDADILLPIAHRNVRTPTPIRPNRNTDAFILNPFGSTGIDETDFYTPFDDGSHSFRNFIFPNRPPKTFASKGGRSTNGNAPYFNIHQAGEGYLIAYGWTGQWNAEIDRTEDAVHFKAKIEDTHFVLYPGEKIRTGSVVVLPYRSSVLDAQNLWRRFMKAHFSPYRGELQKPFSLSFWGGTESKDILSRIDYVIGKCKIPCDMVWMDAGWCGPDTLSSPNEYEGDWWIRVGDWDVSPHIHPRALTDVSEKIKSYGKKYILWFEPERTRATTHLFKEHPEFLINDPERDSATYLINFGNPAALSFIKEKIFGIIESLGLDWYRQDFNTDPHHIWQANDTELRRGMTEIKHIMGLYDFWDEMRARFPHIMIDNCASGGRRLDIEAMKRSIPLWRSDAQCPADPRPEITQANQINFSLWLPYTATGTGRVYDTYMARSAYATGGVGTTYSYSSTEHFEEKPENAAFLLACAEEYRKLRPYFDGDMYPHADLLADETAWSIAEWHRPEEGDGALQVFRRAFSPYPSATVFLHGINAEKTYVITDIDGDEWQVAGKELIQNGLTLTVKEKRTAKIYFYKPL